MGSSGAPDAITATSTVLLSPAFVPGKRKRLQTVDSEKTCAPRATVGCGERVNARLESNGAGARAALTHLFISECEATLEVALE